MFHTHLLLSSLGSGLGDLSTGSLSLVNRLDDTNGNSLTHVTDGESTKGRVVRERLDTHGLGRNHLDNGGITRLDKLGAGFEGLTSSTINLFNELRELAGNVGSVTVKDGSVASTDLTGVVEDNDLGIERGGANGGVVLGVGADHAATNVLDGNVLDIESDIVTGESFGESLVMHFDRLDFSRDIGRGKGDNHAGLDDSSLDTANRHRSDTANLVHVLERETEGLVSWASGGLNGINGLEEGLSSDGRTALAFLGPALEPGHVLGGLEHIVTVPSGDGNHGHSLGVVPNLFNEPGDFLANLIEPVLGPLVRVHLVDGNNELLDSEGVSEESVLAGLTVFGDTGLELSDSTGDDEDSAVGLFCLCVFFSFFFSLKDARECASASAWCAWNVYMYAPQMHEIQKHSQNTRTQTLHRTLCNANKHT